MKSQLKTKKGVVSYRHCGRKMRLAPAMVETLRYIETGPRQSRSAADVCGHFGITLETYRQRVSTIRRELDATRNALVVGIEINCRAGHVYLEDEKPCKI